MEFVIGVLGAGVGSGIMAIVLAACQRKWAKEDKHDDRATDVDHIVDHKGDWDKFADRSNLESLCHSCHSRKTARELWQNRAKNKRR